MAANPRIIKKYPNRRLYDTDASAYITLQEVKQLVLEQKPFVVRDAKSGEDLTRAILLQIILEEEAGGVPMFSEEALAQIIRFYGHAMQGVMGTFLERSIQAFIEAQRSFQQQAQAVYGDTPRLTAEMWGNFLKAQAPAFQSMMGNYLEQSATAVLNMQEELKKQTMRMFTPFPVSGSEPVQDEPDSEARGGKKKPRG